MMTLPDEPVYSEMVKSLREVFLIDLFFDYFCVYQPFIKSENGNDFSCFLLSAC